MQLLIDGIEIDIVRKNIKNIHLSVLPPDGKVRLSLPFSVNEEAALLFARSKISWIVKQIEKFENQPRFTIREFVSGENLYVFGKLYKLQVVYANSNRITIQGEKVVLQVKAESTASQREKYVNEWYRKLLKQKLGSIFEKWQQITGLKCNSWQIKYMKTRWGTFSPATQKVWLNLQLAKKTVECIEYVVLHELAHSVERNHGKQFIAIMDKFMPNWRTLKNDLNKQILDYLE